MLLQRERVRTVNYSKSTRFVFRLREQNKPILAVMPSSGTRTSHGRKTDSECASVLNLYQAAFNWIGTWTSIEIATGENYGSKSSRKGEQNLSVVMNLQLEQSASGFSVILQYTKSRCCIGARSEA